MRRRELKADAGELLALLSFRVRYPNAGLPEFGKWLSKSATADLDAHRPGMTAERAKTRSASHHLALPQLGDLVGAEAEFGKHFLGLLAELRRPRRHPARRARQREGLADQADVAVLVVRHVLRHAEMLDLGVLEHLVDRIDRAAGHAGGVELP